MENLTEKKLQELFEIDYNAYSKKVQKGLTDVQVNHNMCWIRDLYEKNKNNLDNIALFYRGTKITYRDLFKNAEKYASALEKKGVRKGMEVPVCMAPCPEFIYVLMAINLLGAKINSFGYFDKNYVTEIIDGCDTDFIISDDYYFGKIKDSVDASKTKEIVLFSLTDSLINGKDPYIEIDKYFYDFENKVSYYKQDRNVSSKQEFLSLADSNPKKITDYDKGDIDDEFLVTYTSGSTNYNHPKAIIHRNRSLITMGRFQDPDLSGLPNTKGLIGEMLIPTNSNTSIITSMSDVLYKGCTVALEPIFNPDFLIYSLAINKPNFIAVSKNMILNIAKKLYSDVRFENFKMPYMMMLTSVGEPTTIGEEKFINKMLRKAKCGTGKLPYPLAPVPLSVGGGDCERGGMFFTAYRTFQDLNPKYKIHKARCGMRPYAMVQLAVLDENGNKLENGQIGRLVIKTPTMMKGYKNNEKATREFFIKDASGETWSDANVYAVIEKYGTLEILERIGKELVLDDGTKIPLFYIGKEVEKDTKHIMSYEVVNIDNEIVVHIELQPDMKNNIPKILMGIEERIAKKYGEKVTSKILYRVRSFEEGFVSGPSGKRSYQALVNEGITENCVKPIYKNGEIILQHNEKEKILVKK